MQGFSAREIMDAVNAFNHEVSCPVDRRERVCLVPLKIGDPSCVSRCYGEEACYGGLALTNYLSVYLTNSSNPGLLLFKYFIVKR